MTIRTPVAAGNWKLNTTVDEGLALCRDLAGDLAGLSGAEVILFPPFTHLYAARAALAGSGIRLGAQNVFWEEQGAYTGEIGPSMLRPLVSHVLIGHSERRALFGETDATVHQRFVAALAVGLIPVLCVGETLAERDAGEVEQVLTRQVSVALEGIAAGAALLVAYEPVWAIGTGRAANGEQANATMGFIRRLVAKQLSPAVADKIRILYGGSVNAKNIGEFMTQPEIDGGLVGGASLSAMSFGDIARLVAAARQE